jgi:hypothetical protein
VSFAGSALCPKQKSGGEAGASPPDQSDTAMESKADIEL